MFPINPDSSQSVTLIFAPGEQIGILHGDNCLRGDIFPDLSHAAYGRVGNDDVYTRRSAVDVHSTFLLTCTVLYPD
jgi:hypothetical protein